MSEIVEMHFNQEWKIELINWHLAAPLYKTKKQQEHFQKYYLKRPFWVRITRTWDDDMMMTREFNTIDEAYSVFLEMVTTPNEIDTKGFW